jgi:spermidine dehydrogenase
LTVNVPSSSITRRDFVNGMLVATGAGLLPGVPGSARATGVAIDASLPDDWYGYGGVGDYRLSHGNTPEAVAMAHRIRDGGFGRIDRMSGPVEEYDLVIVGGGMAALGAALEYCKKRRAGQTCLLLDNHPVFGGEAKENEFDVNGITLLAPQGSNGFFLPPAVDDPDGATGDARYYAELGIPRDLPYRDWPADQAPLGFCKDNYGYLVVGLQEQISVGHFFRSAASPGGSWAVDMWRQQLANTPLSPGERGSLLEWYRAGRARQFATDQEARRYLDRMSYKDYLERKLGQAAAGSRYADLFLASALGLGSDAVSAYAAYTLPMPGLNAPPGAGLERHSFPGGNSGYARYFLKSLIPESIAGGREFADIITGKINFSALDRQGQPLRMRLDATAVSVQHEGPIDASERVRVVYAHAGRLRLARAKSVIMATGGWINRYVVRDMPEGHRNAYGQFRHAPFLVANVAVNNWRFMHRLGITAAIWEKTDDGFGRTCNIRRPMVVGRHHPPLDPSQPAVLSFYTPFYYPGLSIDEQVRRGRIELLTTSYPAFERKIVNQMLELFGSAGFDATRDIAGIILNRWGHAFSVPYPGFYGGAGDQPAPRDIIRRSYGRVAFAHSELGGLQHWGPAADEGRRAFGQIASAMAA